MDIEKKIKTEIEIANILLSGLSLEETKFEKDVVEMAGDPYYRGVSDHLRAGLIAARERASSTH